MKKFILGLVLGTMLSFSTITYAAESLEVLLFPVKFFINGKDKEVSNGYSVFNLNGSTYVPLRFIAENLNATVHYNEIDQRIIIQSSDAKFEYKTLAPSPFVSYERKYSNGVIWNQEIPLLQGSGCYLGCLDVPQPADLIKLMDYEPISVQQKSSLIINYPKGMEPKSTQVFKLVGNDLEELKFENGRLVLSDPPGTYTLVIHSDWEEDNRLTTNVFAVDIK